MKTVLLSLLVVIAVFPVVYAQTFSSGSQRVNVLELYTSEGCSSCPPADRYVSGFRDDDELWSRLIPIVFHVDYWNYIGWPDRFSSERNSERQRIYARQDNVSTVYTPGFILNGKEWRSFFGLRRLALDDEIVGTLEIMLEDGRVSGIFMPENPGHEELTMNIAILGFDLVTRVEAGENRGKTLRHDFTVLAHKKITMHREGDTYTVTGQLPELSVKAPRTALAAWVNRKNDQTPLQATGGWLDK